MRWVCIALVAALGIFVEPTSCRSENEAQGKTFEVVWNKVNETYFDPVFGGLNWKDVHDRYQPRIAAAMTDKEFYELVNDMLWELKASHANLIPPGSIARYEPIVFAEGSPGIDVRLLKGAAAITSVKPESPAHAAGISPGYVIQALDGIPVEQIAREAELRVPPPANSRSRAARITKAILSRVYGAPGTEVVIVYLDKEGEKREQRITREKRNGVSIGPIFMAIEFEARRLGNGIGYVRVNTLQPQLTPQIAEAIKAMGNVRGIILDLRGNSGGEIENMPELFVRERTLLYLRTSRDGETEVFSSPADSASAVPLVLLIDALSGSASELLSACLQAAGRAVIVGERSPGAVLESDTMILPNGSIFMYPVAQLKTPDGTVLEGHGVVPDVEVGLDRGMLLKGVDSQLDAAIGYIEDQKK
jgi:carboxyl-terminal processing protease